MTMKQILWIIALILTFNACQNETKQEIKATSEKTQEEHVSISDFDHKAYKMKGKIIAQNTFKVFKSNIQRIALEKGLTDVVNFCHDNAEKIVDSLSKTQHVVIKRTSHKLRNDNNQPDADSKVVLDKYLQLQAEQKPLEPVVKKDTDGYVHFYAPIQLKKECLKCHGEPEKEIHEDIYKLIQSKYPHDKATGFKEGELRGIWDIKFLDMADK